MGWFDMFDPAMGSFKRMMNFEESANSKSNKDLPPSEKDEREIGEESSKNREAEKSDFDLDAFLKSRLSLDYSKLDGLFEDTNQKTDISTRRVYRSTRRVRAAIS
jgi:hypothetical protein